jgi:membrane protein DedA with SNARE-associated domain
VLAEQIGLPLPAVPFLLAAGGLVGSGRLDLGLVLAVAGIASLLSDTLWYWVGRVQGVRVLGWLCRMSLRPDSCVQGTERVFRTHGARSLLIAKFVPGYNTVAPPLAHRGDTADRVPRLLGCRRRDLGRRLRGSRLGLQLAARA